MGPESLRIKEGVPLASQAIMNYALSIDPSVLEGTGHLLHYIMTAARVADTMAAAFEEATRTTLDRQRMMDLLVTQHAVKIQAGLAREGRLDEATNQLFQEGGLPPNSEHYKDLPGAHTFDDVDFALWSGEQAKIDPVVLRMLNLLRKRHAGKQLAFKLGGHQLNYETGWAFARSLYHARRMDGKRDWAVTLKELAAWITDRGMVTNLEHRLGKIKEHHVGEDADKEGDAYKGGGVKLLSAREIDGLAIVGQTALQEFCDLIGIEPENFYSWLKERLDGIEPDALAQELWDNETFPEGSFYPQGEGYRLMLRFFDFLRRANRGKTHVDIDGNPLELDRDGIRHNLENLLRQL